MLWGEVGGEVEDVEEVAVVVVVGVMRRRVAWDRGIGVWWVDEDHVKKRPDGWGCSVCGLCTERLYTRPFLFFMSIRYVREKKRRHARI